MATLSELFKTNVFETNVSISKLALFNFESANTFSILFGDYDAEVTPVPIPNTEVKLCSADGTWREAARESRSSPEQTKRTLTIVGVLFFVDYDAEVTPVSIPNTEKPEKDASKPNLYLPNLYLCGLPVS